MSRHPPPTWLPTELLITLGMPFPKMERLARAMSTTIQPLCHTCGAAVDLTVLVPDALPNWVREFGVEPFYVRAFSQHLVTGSTTMQ